MLCSFDHHDGFAGTPLHTMNQSSISVLVGCFLLTEAVVIQRNCSDLHEQCTLDAAINEIADVSLSLLQRGAKVKKGLGVHDGVTVDIAQSPLAPKWNPDLASGVDPWMILTLVIIICIALVSVYIAVGTLPISTKMSSNCKLASWNILAMVFLCLALYGRYHFLTAPLLRGQPHTGTGYSRLDLVGLVCFIWCLPVAAVLGLSSLLSHFARSKCIVWVSFGALVCGLFVVWAAFESRDLLPCMFCQGQACSNCTDEMDPEGFRLLVGLELLLVNVVFFVVFVAIGVRACRGKPSSNAQPFDVNPKNYQRDRIFAGASLAILINPLLFLFTSIFPNDMVHLASGSIHKYVSRATFTAELPTAWMITTNVRLSDDVVLKFFPDTIIFYSLLEVLSLASLATVLFPGLQRIFAKRLLKDMTFGEILSACILATAVCFWVFYWLFEHRYGGGSGWLNAMMRTWGQTAVLFMSLALLPASKSSIWLKALGVSWEKAVWVHRWFGYATLACILCHFLSFWAVCIFTYQTFPHDAFAMQLFLPYNGVEDVPSYDDFTIALMQLVAYPAIFMIGIPAWRRQGKGNSWEWFKYLHFVFLALIPATLLHACSSYYFLLGGIAFWIFDAALRYAGVADLNTKLLTMEVSDAEGGVTRLTFSKTHGEPGQFAWIKVPAISEWEWHPFSLCSAPIDGHSEMCIKSMGPNTFTDNLFQLAKTSQEEKAKPFKIFVDGPHGIGFGPLLADRTAILLLAGGIGITPMHSTFRALAQRSLTDSATRSVKLVWIAKSADLFEIFAESIDFCLKCSDTMSIELFATGKEAAKDRSSKGTRLSASLRKHLQLGRPDFEEIMGRACAQLKGGSCLVLACGPESMVESAASAARTHDDIDFENALFRL